MKKLLNTLYVASADRYLSLDGENVVVLEKQNEIGRVPLHNLEEIITCGYTGASPALMCACAERNISLCFLTPEGKFLARVTGHEHGNVVVRKTQYRYSEDAEKCLDYAKNFITGKLFNSRWVIERAIRDYAARLDVEMLHNTSQIMQTALQRTRECTEIGSLRGIEGEAASSYFGAFDQLIIQQKNDFNFQIRTKRPPLDNVNALLSFSYTLLASMCASALETVGLDPYVGFMHTDRPGRTSLALDLMEELRSVFADRFVLTLINKKIITAKDFLQQEDGAVFLAEEARKKFFTAWQNKKKEEIIHPFLNEKVEWGMVPYVQALLLSRCIRGDLDFYPPFMWK